MPKDKSKTSSRPLSRRVVLTGGPAAGKTAVCEVLRRQLEDEVAVLPEMATLLFRAGFPRPKDEAGKRLLQQTIYAAQRNLEGIYEIMHADKTHICDRGTLDGAAYWPGGLDRFLGAMGTTLEAEYRKYDAVIFLQTSAYEGGAYKTESNVRTETPAQARAVDARLLKIWEQHPNFYLVTHEPNFYEKVASVLISLHRALGLGSPHPNSVKTTSKGKK
ncbi:MAG: putative ATPase [Planctomycetota bacterium]|jgi:predicted ATPase